MKSPITLFREKTNQSLEAFGKMFGVEKTTVRYWERVRVPPERVAEIEKATGIPRHELRPDLYEGAA
jgi:DNA-binding transcriptional regulator YdaS (Cro superfamily)